MSRYRIGRRGFVTLALCLALSSVAYADHLGFLSGFAYPLDGVDDTGERDPALGAAGDAISVIYRPSGLIIQIAVGEVTNESGARKRERNIGSFVINPDTEEPHVARSDLYICGAAGRCRLIGVGRANVDDEI